MGCIVLAAMGRSQSTPGLVESRGRVPLEDMWVSPYGLLSSALPVVPPRPPQGAHTPDSPAGSVSSSGRSSRSHHQQPQQLPTRPGKRLHSPTPLTLFTPSLTLV